MTREANLFAAVAHLLCVHEGRSPKEAAEIAEHLAQHGGWGDPGALAEAQAKRALNLNDPAIQKRLAAQWGYVQAPAEGATVLVPLAVLEDASRAIGNFVSDHGWADSDMQAMDNLDAYIARHKANAAASKAQPKGTEAGYIVSVVMARQSPGVVNTQNKLYGVEAVSPDEATGKAIAMAQSDFPEHQLHTSCYWALQAPAPAPEPLRKIVAITSRSPGMTERELGLSMGRIQEICEAALAAPCAAVEDEK